MYLNTFMLLEMKPTALGQDWVQEQEQRLLEGDSEGVLKSLKSHLEEESLEDSKAPVRKAYRYLSSRKDQLDYPEAKAEGLPLGSGMIEGVHRHVLQNRLKKIGSRVETRQPLCNDPFESRSC